MYLFKSLVIQMIILLVIQIDQPEVHCLDDKDGGFFSSIGKIIPSIPFLKKDEPKKDFWGREIKEEKTGWFGFGKKKQIQSEDNNSGWFPSIRKLNLLSTRDLNDMPLSQDRTVRDASDASKSALNQSNWDLLLSNFNFSNYNLSNYNFSAYKLSNYNFNFSNWQILPKINYTNELNYTDSLPINFTVNLETSKDWLSSFSFATFKARYYGNLLNNTSSNETNDTTNLTSHSSQNISQTDLNLTNFRERLIKVYDNYTRCIHPCKEARVKKNSVSAQITINGCGPSYFSDRQLMFIPFGEFFKECCDNHDSHYANCGFTKQEADYDFLDCMLSKIDRTTVENKNIWRKIRMTFGYTLFGLVDMFGCKAWEISQKEVCDCN